MPAQTNLYRTCVSLRVARSIIMWRDSIAAFWIVSAALLASFIVFWVPWAFIFRWAFKIFVYVVLGPWMKLVDICYVKKRQSMSRAERQAQTEAEFQKRYDMLLGQSFIRRLLNERNQKMSDLKRYLFGKVSSLHSQRTISWQSNLKDFRRTCLLTQWNVFTLTPSSLYLSILYVSPFSKKKGFQRCSYRLQKLNRTTRRTLHR